MKIYKVIAIVLIGFWIVLSTGCDKDTVSMADPEIDSTVTQKSLNSEINLPPEMIDILIKHGIDPDNIEYDSLSEVKDYLLDKDTWEKLLKEQGPDISTGRTEDSLSFRYPLEEEHLFRSSATPAQAQFTVVDMYDPPASGSISVHYEGVQVRTYYSSGDSPMGVAMAIRSNINNDPNIQLTAGTTGSTVVLTEKRPGCGYNGKAVYITSSLGTHICVNHGSTYTSGGTDDGTGCTSIVPAAPNLKLPNIGATNRPVDGLWMEWFPSYSATSYHIQVATNPNFTNLVLNTSGINNTGVWVNDLNFNTTYYWRVRARNAIGFGAWSSNWSFTTIPLPTTSSSYIYNYPSYVVMVSASSSTILCDLIKVESDSYCNGQLLAKRSNEENNSKFVQVGINVTKDPWHSSYLQTANHTYLGVLNRDIYQTSSWYDQNW